MKQRLVNAPIFAVVLVAWLASGQVPPADSDYRVRTTTELVLLDVAAETPQGRSVAGLTKGNFKVYENGKLQPITSFNHDDQPVSVGLVVDQSGSMRPKQWEVLDAARAFVRASNPQDEMFVVNFNDTVSLGLPPAISFTDDVNDLQNAIRSTRPEGRTALNDAVILALDHLALGTKERKSLLVISDGGDNASTHSEAEMLSKAEEVQATIYTIGLFTDDDQDRNPGLLRRLAAISGGETYLPDDPSKVSEILSHIAKEIRSRYSIGYVPVRTSSAGGLRKVRVEAVDEKGTHLVVHTRTRYRLPELESTSQKENQP
jgi:Ca-activated chloride channel family protein